MGDLDTFVKYIELKRITSSMSRAQNEYVNAMVEHVPALGENVFALGENVLSANEHVTMVSPHNVGVHRAAANKLNNENRATRGSVCNALLCGDCDVPQPLACDQFNPFG